MLKALLLMVFTTCVHGYASSLFDSAVSGSNESTAMSAEFNGYTRANTYIGRDGTTHDAQYKSQLAEFALKARAKKGDFGEGYAELRISKSVDEGVSTTAVDIREAFVSAYIGSFDIKVGQQVVVWGRADGFNPTNNITPIDLTMRSPNEDDRRLSNFLVRAYYNILPLRLEFIWVPKFKPSTSTFSISGLPAMISNQGEEFPEDGLKSGSFATKVNFEGTSIDGSISFYDGYSHSGGYDLSYPALTKRFYRQRVYGADFSTSLLSPYGLRGEFAYKEPYYPGVGDHNPNKEINYVVGVDKEYFQGTLSLILQYVGKHVVGFKEVPDTVLNIAKNKNRIFWGQTKETTHSISLRPELKFLNETFKIEMLGLYNFTTKELLLKPKVSYDITDGMTVSVGGDYYQGPKDTMMGMVEDTLNAGFAELKVSF